MAPTRAASARLCRVFNNRNNREATMRSFVKVIAVSTFFAGLAGTAHAQDAATDGPVLSGVLDASVQNDYITPRGVVVTTHGVALQTLGAATLAFSNGLAFTGGVWVDFNPGYSKTAAGTRGVNETDPFFGVSYKATSKLTVGARYWAFIGDNFPRTANNLEFSVDYADGGPGRALSINPYAKLFWEVSGSSTTGVGKNGHTFDVELGAVPTYDAGPVILSAPTWITLGPKSFFGPIHDGNVGVISTGLKIAKPLDLGPRAGKWTLYAKVQYYHLANENLVLVKSALNEGDHDSDQVQFGVGINVGF
jgi:hypothetical protein